MGNSRLHNWTDARVAALSELWLSGHTSGECASQLGVSRNSAIGKLRRLGLLRQDRPRMPIVRRAARLLSSSEQVSKRPNKWPLPPPEPYRAPPPPPLPEYGSLRLLDLRHNSCRWPGPEDRPPYSFCGRPQAPNSSYCSEHHVRSMSGLARGVPHLSRSVTQA
jgi:hypothetical protein